HNHRATIARLHAALTLACQAGQPWWRSVVWDPRHDRRIPVREREPREGPRRTSARVSPAWLREAIQWCFAAGLSTGLLSWSSLPSFLSYLGRHFAAFLAAEGIDTPDLGADPEAGIRPVALRLAAWLRQQRSSAGRPLAPPTIGLIQTTVAGFYAFMADRRAEAARELAEPRWAGPTDAHARWWRPGEIAGSGSYRGQADGNYIDAAAPPRIAGQADILGPAGHRRRPAPLPREHPERAAHPARRRAAGHRRHRGGGGLPAHPPDASYQGHRPAERGRADPRRAALYGASLTGNDHALRQDPGRDPRG